MSEPSMLSLDVIRHAGMQFYFYGAAQYTSLLEYPRSSDEKCVISNDTSTPSQLTMDACYIVPTSI